MRARLLRTLSLLLLASLTGCVKAYEPPALNEPHALLKLRRVYHAAPGTWRLSSIYIGDEQLMHESESNRPAPAAHSGTRVRPGPVRVTVGSTFWHTEMRWVSETYTESVPYSAIETHTETVHHGCPTTTPFCSRQETRTRWVTHYRTETKTRMVWKPVDVMDDACQRFAVRAIEPGHTYTMQFTYTGASLCSIVCFEQYRTEAPPGFAYRPCRVPSAAEDGLRRRNTRLKTPESAAVRTCLHALWRVIQRSSSCTCCDSSAANERAKRATSGSRVLTATAL